MDSVIWVISTRDRRGRSLLPSRQGIYLLRACFWVGSGGGFPVSLAADVMGHAAGTWPACPFKSLPGNLLHREAMVI